MNYTPKFRNIKSSAVGVVKELAWNDKYFDLDKGDKLGRLNKLIDLLGVLYGLGENVKMHLVQADVIKNASERYVLTVDTIERCDEDEENIKLFTVIVEKPRVTDVLAAFRQVLVETGKAKNVQRENDAKAWAASVLYAADSAEFEKSARKGYIPGVSR